jgi:hypothetical protein
MRYKQMSSVVSQLAQIPRGSHFRPIPSLSALSVTSSVFTFTADSGVAPRLTYNSATVGVTGSFSAAPWVVGGSAAAGGFNTQLALSSGSAILKDLGETIVSSGRTFRRVQLLASGSVTEQNYGSYTGVDSDALCGYIEVGFRGVGTPGPFVRAY